MVFSRAFIFLFLLLFASFVVLAQDDPPIRVETSIVRLNVGVVDQKGRPVTSLNQSNFQLYEDGVKQEITRFEPTATPFSVAILLDMSGSTYSFRQTIKLSASRFIDALSPEDRVAVIEFYDLTKPNGKGTPKINLLNNFTTNRNSILNSIQVANGLGKTPMFEAIDFALDKLAKENSRRKAIIILTDGVDTVVQNQDRGLLEQLKDEQISTAIIPSKNETLNQVLNRADAQGVTIYPLALPTGDPAKLADPTPRQVAMFKAARTRLQIVADRTGGRLNTINRLEEMGRLYAEVAADLRTLYTVEYTSTNEKRDGKWRAIRIDVRNPDLISRTRQGYFAK